MEIHNNVKILNNLIDKKSNDGIKKSSSGFATSSLIPIDYKMSQAMKAIVTFSGLKSTKQFNSSKALYCPDYQDFSIPVGHGPKEKSKLHFKENLSPEEELYINSLDISENRRELLKRVLLLETEEGKRFYGDDDIECLILNSSIPEYRIENMLQRNLINTDLIEPYESYFFSNCDEQRWQEIEQFAFDMYKTSIEDRITEFRITLSNYCNGFSDIESLLRDYSNAEISNIICKCFSKDYAQRLNNNIRAAFQNGNTESSNLEMLLMLIKDKKLPAYVLCLYDNNSSLNNNIVSDLDKLYDAYMQNKDIEEVFLPEFQDDEDACENLEVGEICKLANERNICIKMDDGLLKQLEISPNAYLKLFSPVERYIYTQSRQGNCYLISSINSINSNPKLRYMILELFKENEDGTIDIEFSKDKGHIDNFVLKDVGNVLNNEELQMFSSQTCEGLRAIEMLFEKYAQHKADKNIRVQYETFKEALTHLDENDCVYIGDFRYTKEEIEMFIRNAELYFSDSNENKKSLISLSAGYADFDVSPSLDDEDEENALNDENELSKFKRLINDRYKEYFERTNNQSRIFDDIVPFSYAEYLFGESFDFSDTPKLYTGMGGKNNNIYNVFGLKTSVYFNGDNSDELRQILNQPISEINYIINASTSEDIVSDGFLRPRHGYSIKPKDIQNERKFLVQDPHNTAFERIMNFDELLKYFTNILITKK